MSPVRSEPSPEFESLCLEIYHKWKTGQTPFREAIEQFAALAQQALESGVAVDQARVEHLLGNIQGQRGNFNASLTHFERARSLFQGIGNWRYIAAMDHNIGETYRNQGDYTRARQLFRKTYDIASQHNFPDLKMIASANEGQMLLNMERYAAAEAPLMQALELFTTEPQHTHRHEDTLAEIYYGLALVQVHHDNLPGAWDYARRSLTIARKSGELLVMGIAYRALGDVATRLSAVPVDDLTPHDNPDLYYQTALQTLREARNDAELARTMLAFGKSLARRGRQLAAAQQLQQAMILFTRLEMVADAAKAAHAQLEVTS